MKALQCIIIVAAMTFVLPAKAQNGVDQRPGPASPVVGGTLVPIYLVPGVRSSGVDNSGAATSFACTVLSGVTETLKFRIFDSLGTLLIDQNVGVDSPKTQTASTNATQLFSELLLGAPLINPPGLGAIYATSNLVFCTAMLVDAADLAPKGIALHLIRYTPVSGTQE